jgi:hypothetical protein
MSKSDWRTKLTEAETLRLARYDQQIAIQTAAVTANPENHDLAAMLALLKYRRYTLQSRVAARGRRSDLKRQRLGSKPRALVAA